MTMKLPFLLAAVVAVLSLQPGVAQAAQRGQVVVGASFNGGHGGHWRGGHWGGVRLGIGIGFGVPYYYGAPYYGGPYYYPGTVLVAPPLAYAEPAPVPMALEPVIYPRNGQTPTQTEGDRQACNRWAMSQPSAVADASVFHRATLACMEGRGYTVR